MRVFVTGATGWIGTPTVAELLGAGHQVLGLARSEEGEAKLVAAGAEVLRADLTDTAALAKAASETDGVIHLGFVHDFANYEQSLKTDFAAIQAMLDAIEGTDKPFVGTSGTLMTVFGQQPTGKTSTEETPGIEHGRAAAEKLVREAAGRGIRSSVIRLSPTVHGQGDKGFIPMIIGCDLKAGVAAFPGDGSNRWPAVHRLDAAKLYRLAFEKGKAGSLFNGVDEEGVSTRSIAETISAGTGLPAKSLNPEETQAHFTWMAMFVGLDNPTSSAITQQALGWKPTGPKLLEDIRNHYLTNSSSKYTV